MISSYAFRTFFRHGASRHRSLNGGAFVSHGRRVPSIANSNNNLSCLFSTKEVTSVSNDNGKSYTIKSTSYKNTAYDLENKSSGLTGSYDPSSFEKAVYDWWEQSGCFDPDANIASSNKDGGDKREPYVLPMPPPNVTGRLHMGHAIFVALQDVLARFHRMRGKSVLWTPGTDHAGIATQLQVKYMIAVVIYSFGYFNKLMYLLILPSLSGGKTNSN